MLYIVFHVFKEAELSRWTNDVFCRIKGRPSLVDTYITDTAFIFFYMWSLETFKRSFLISCGWLTNPIYLLQSQLLVISTPYVCINCGITLYIWLIIVLQKKLRIAFSIDLAL